LNLFLALAAVEQICQTRRPLGMLPDGDACRMESLTKRVSRKAAKTRWLAQNETHKVLGILASWREKTEGALQLIRCGIYESGHLAPTAAKP